jgi:hypothetical protein
MKIFSKIYAFLSKKRKLMTFMTQIYVFYLFNQVTFSWRVVAKVTQRRYGIWKYITQGRYGNMAIIAQMSVLRTRRTSRAARRLFFRRNSSGVKARLKMIFKINGSMTINGSPACAGRPKRKTLPKEIKMRTYNTLHTGPKSHEGGAHFGFFSCEYQ